MADSSCVEFTDEGDGGFVDALAAGGCGVVGSCHCGLEDSVFIACVLGLGGRHCFVFFFFAGGSCGSLGILVVYFGEGNCFCRV